MESTRSARLEIKVSSKKITNKYLVTLVFLFMVLIIRVLILIVSSRPELVENIYSSTLYPYIGTILASVTSIFSFSLGEMIIILLPIIGILLIIYMIRGSGTLNTKFSNLIHLLIRAIAFIYISFYLLWGFNYYREDYISLSGWQYKEATFEALIDLSNKIILETNELRVSLDENENGIFELRDGFQDLGLIALDGFKDYSIGSYRLDRVLGRAKPIILSKYMSYTGITGVYFPFTAEANVNTSIPHITMLSTISHEIAHLKGFAKEDEANFIAYKANINNRDKRFQYSGYYLAMTYLLNEVYNQDIDEYTRLFNMLSNEVRRDMDFSREFWKSRQGRAEELMTNVNDKYLKSNHQDQGVKSYNGVVKLLLAEYTNNKGIED